MKISELSEVDRKVIDGIDNAVRSRGADWRYPNGKIDGERIPGAWEWEPDSGFWQLKSFDPDWTNDGGQCRNLLANGTPACIIGFVAVDQGLPIDRIGAVHFAAQAWWVGNAVLRGMNDAQGKQDNGYSWGESRRVFYKTLRDCGVDTEGREDLI